MPDLKTIADEARGPLSKIEDAIARREIGKLWTVVEGRLPATGKAADPHTLATHADLTRTESALSKRIEALQAQTRSAVQQSGSSRAAAATANLTPPVRIHQLEAGAIQTAHPAITLPTTLFSATLDLQRTTNVASATQEGGAATLFVQHRVDGTGAGLVTGLRSQMETRQSGGTAVSGYFGVQNEGASCSGFGLFVDAYHRGGGDTVGVNVQMQGADGAPGGTTVGILLRQSDAAGYARHGDYGFLATSATIHYPFAAGSAWSGPLACEVAFDAGHARPSLAAVRIGTGDKLVFDGPTQNAWSLSANGAQGGDAALQVRGPSLLMSVRADGDVVVHSGTLAINRPRSPADPTTLRLWGYFAVELGGSRRWVPFYD